MDSKLAAILAARMASRSPLDPLEFETVPPARLARDPTRSPCDSWNLSCRRPSACPGKVGEPYRLPQAEGCLSPTGRVPPNPPPFSVRRSRCPPAYVVTVTDRPIAPACICPQGGTVRCPGLIRGGWRDVPIQQVRGHRQGVLRGRRDLLPRRWWRARMPCSRISRSTRLVLAGIPRPRNSLTILRLPYAP